MQRKHGIGDENETCPDEGEHGHGPRGSGLGGDHRRHRAAPDARTLSDVAPGTGCTIHRLYGHGPARQRLLDLGFQPGRTVKVLRNAPLNDPVEVQLGDTFIALRRHEADHVEVDPASETSHAQGDTDD